MTGLELAFCTSAVLSSSTSQMFIKAATIRNSPGRSVILLGIGLSLLIFGALLAVLALRTLNLSQLIPFAALAYVLVPLGSHFVFRDRLLPRFWIGTILIVGGILCTNF
jgi:drug/metabolite transporter (DMT)-like permease